MTFQTVSSVSLLAASLHCDAEDAALCLEATTAWFRHDALTTVEACLRRHRARPGDHGHACMPCGWLQAAVYRAQTGRSLATDFFGPDEGPEGMR
jgi:hypothetical protein